MATHAIEKRAAKAYVARLVELGMPRQDAKAKCLAKGYPVTDAEMDEPDNGGGSGGALKNREDHGLGQQ